MRHSLYACPVAICTSLWFLSTMCCAADLQRGQNLHDEVCVICHDSSVYTREDRRVQTLEQLTTRVDLCQQDVGTEWSPAQIDDVVGYLNDSFYRFTDIAPAAQ